MVVPIVLKSVGLSNCAGLLIRIVRWPAMFVGVALALALIYRFGPDRNTRPGTSERFGRTNLARVRVSQVRDHDDARRAVEAGEIRPLADILKATSWA